MPDDGASEAPPVRPETTGVPVGPVNASGALITTTPPGTVARFASARLPSTPFWIALALGILVAVVFVLSASALFVFGVGVAMAFFLVPVVSWLEGRGLQRWIAAILVVVVTVLAVLVVLGAMLVILVEQGAAFLQGLPELMDEMAQSYGTLPLPDWLRSSVDAAAVAADENLVALDQGAVVSGVLGGLLDLVSGLFAWFLLPFFLFYLLKDQPRMAATFYARVPAPWKDDVSRILTITVGNFAQYFKAEFLVGSIMFVTVAVGMLVIGLVTDSPLLIDFAILLGLIAFVMELIPQIGPILSYIPALFLALASGPEALILVSVFYFIVFNIEGSVLVPTFEGRMISFSGASVLVLIAVGFALAGIIGAILALPLASIIRDLFRLLFDKAVAQDLVIEPAVVAESLPGPAGP